MTRLGARLAGALAVTLAAALTACGSTTAGGSSGGETTYRVGITQIVSHPSLDAAREGFKRALTDAGVKVTYDEQNAQGDQATATSIAAKFGSAKLDLVLAIATPTAQASAQAITKTPILFTAVTDPVAAKLVASNEAPGSNITGTTDLNPVAEQIALIKKIKPSATSVGILYSSGEVNSQVQADAAKKAAQEQGLTVVEKTVTATGEVGQAAAALGTDAVYVPTDNTVVSGLASVVQVCEQKKLPLVVGEGDSVAKGGAITYGIDYSQLGYQTGQMAVRILTQQAKPATMPVEKQKDLKVYVNQAAAQRMGLTLPDALLEGAEVVG